MRCVCSLRVPRRPGKPLTWSRQYTLSPLDSIPALAPTRKLPELPSPGEFSGRILPIDFLQYLVPLYDHGWQFVIERPSSEVQARGSLRRFLNFPKLEGLVKFSQNTRDIPGANISVSRNLDTGLQFRSPERLTRDQIRLAFATEIEYLKIVGPDMPAPVVKPSFRITSLNQMHSREQATYSQRQYPAAPPETVPIAPSPLPPAPPDPGISPPPLTAADLETYIKPLVAAGWSIVGPPVLHRYRETQLALKGRLCLHRVYYFTGYTAARHFMHAATAAIPVRAPGSFAGVDILLRATAAPDVYSVAFWSLSEFAAPDNKRYGISLADVRLAIEMENEITINWAGRTQCRPLYKGAWVPDTMEEMWESMEKKYTIRRNRVWG
ncbi:hypothetical protein B0H11DRAFT_2072572 [Mycena galericulata]|nr:hypothetical protein B0H11DRAFT_2072572 [Mycena galericulata]